MQASDLAIAGFIHENFQVILQHLQALQQGRPAAGSDMPRLLSIEQVIEELEVSRSTVQRWLKKGKPGRHGTTIVLQAYWFTTAKPRIPIAEIGLNLVSEISSNPKNAAAFPAPFNGIYLLATNALSVVRAWPRPRSPASEKEAALVPALARARWI